MIELGPHAIYIVWSYLGAVAVIAAMIGYIVWDRRRVNAQLRALEAQGIRRRSGGPAA